MTQIADKGKSRVFLIAGQARPDHKPAYQSMMRAGGVSQDFGDVERIEAPDPAKWGGFITVGEIKGPTKRATTTLTGRYLADTASELLKQAKAGCLVDLQIHQGICTNPAIFNTFTKAVILERANLSNWKVDDLGALSSDEQGKVDEQADVSADAIYEVLPLTFAPAAEALIVSEVVDAVICGGVSCGDCDAENAGRDKVYCLTTVRTGSPGLPAEVLYTVDGGLNWYTSIIAALAVSDSPSAIGCLGDYLFVVGSGLAELDYTPLVDLDGTGAETWTELASQFTVTKEPQDIAVGTTVAWIVGKLGAIYKLDSDVTLGATLQTAASALTTENLTKVAALGDTVAVAVGANNVVLYTTNGETWASVTGPAAGVALTAIAVKSDKIWLVGTASGALYYTLDSGATWTLKGFAGSGAGKVWDIVFATNSVGYLAHATATPRGRVFRTCDGGYSWNLLPESGSAPVCQRVTCVAASANDVNYVVAGGLGGTAGTDGVLLIGEV